MKKRLLIFHPALAPYSIDQYNGLSKIFDLEVVFIFDNVWNHKFDQSALLSQLMFKVSFLLKGLRYKGRVFRFGIYKTIKRVKPDLIFGYEYSFTTQYLVLLKRIGLIPQKIGTTIDDSIEICNHIQSKSRYIARKLTVKHLNYFVVMSDEVSRFYQDTFSLNEKQIIVSPLLQDSGRLRKNNDELNILSKEYLQEYQLRGKKVLLFVGRFIYEKAVELFIDNIHSILRENNNLIVVLIGEGAERENIELKVKERQLTNKVIFPGRFEGQKLYAWYLCASGFVLPSTYEPFGAVVNEALIFGLKVFCSKYAGASYLVSAGKGLLFDPLDKNETTNKLQQFLHDIYEIEEIDMANKPSLMSDYQETFIMEWGKLIYV